MKTAAVSAFMLGLISLYFGLYHPGQIAMYGRASAAQAVAVNFSVFRNAAHKYVYHHPKEALGMSEIAQEHFAQWIPGGWLPMRNWQVRMDKRICYVFGPAEPDEIDAIRKLYRGSFALGRAEGGRLVPDHQGNMPTPAFIPNGSVVSMTEVEP